MREKGSIKDVELRIEMEAYRCVAKLEPIRLDLIFASHSETMNQAYLWVNIVSNGQLSIRITEDHSR